MPGFVHARTHSESHSAGLIPLSLTSAHDPVAGDHGEYGNHRRQPAGGTQVNATHDDEAFEESDQRKAYMVRLAGKPVVVLRNQRRACLHATKQHIQAQQEEPGKGHTQHPI